MKGLVTEEFCEKCQECQANAITDLRELLNEKFKGVNQKISNLTKTFGIGLTIFGVSLALIDLGLRLWVGG